MGLGRGLEVVADRLAAAPAPVVGLLRLGERGVARARRRLDGADRREDLGARLAERGAVGARALGVRAREVARRVGLAPGAARGDARGARHGVAREAAPREPELERRRRVGVAERVAARPPGAHEARGLPDVGDERRQVVGAEVPRELPALDVRAVRADEAPRGAVLLEVEGGPLPRRPPGHLRRRRPVSPAREGAARVPRGRARGRRTRGPTRPRARSSRSAARRACTRSGA